jgi:uncharacterized protein YndB with AHSA1/START domain
VTRTDCASRVVNAGPEEVFAALVDEESLVQWLPPSGVTGRFERFDARPGGSYRLVLEYSDGITGEGKTRKDADVVEVRFIEIVANEKLVQAVDFVSDDPAFVGTMTMTWELFRSRAARELKCVPMTSPRLSLPRITLRV